MKRHLLTSICILILIISCKQQETKKVEQTEQKPTAELKVETKKPIEEIAIPEQYFENDSLRILLESDLKRLTLDSKFDLKAKPKTNTHNKTITDTIKIYTFDKTKIHTYKSLDKVLLCKATIQNSEFEFLKSLKIGVKKGILESILKSELETDLIKIGDLEGNSVFSFKFENETLKLIDYEGYVD